MLEDFSDTMMFHAGELDCCPEAFDGLLESYEETAQLNIALQQRLRSSLASRDPIGGPSTKYTVKLSSILANGMAS